MSIVSHELHKFGHFVKKMVAEVGPEKTEEMLNQLLDKVESGIDAELAKEIKVGDQSFFIPAIFVDSIKSMFIAPLRDAIDMIDGKEG
jgi:hypothetical protein